MPKMQKKSGWTLHPLLVCIAITGLIWGCETESPTPHQNTRGYTIPLIDLAADTSRQFLVDRQPSQYLGHPTTVTLSDGRLLTVYPEGHGKGAIRLQESLDNGRTWSPLPVPDSWSTSQETPTIHLIPDFDDGKRLLVFSGLYPIRMSISRDEGATWSELEPIGAFGGIVAMSSLERLEDGSYMALFHDDGRFIEENGEAGPFYVYQTRSNDGGLTWSAPEVIAQHPGSPFMRTRPDSFSRWQTAGSPAQRK